MIRIEYTTLHGTESMGYVLGEVYDEFYVVKKRAFDRAKKRLKGRKPKFHADKPVYVEGVNIDVSLKK